MMQTNLSSNDYLEKESEIYKSVKKTQYDMNYIHDWWLNLGREIRDKYIKDNYGDGYDTYDGYMRLTHTMRIFIFNKYHTSQRKFIKYSSKNKLQIPHLFKVRDVNRKLQSSYNNTYHVLLDVHNNIKTYDPNWFEKNVLNMKPFDYYCFKNDNIQFLVDVN